ncbi:hypothetical protein HK405_005878 [Cladochytrium tenue]|nr:hypothetical protein HK405_005878 [Cladochytrium tenue]
MSSTTKQALSLLRLRASLPPRPPRLSCPPSCTTTAAAALGYRQWPRCLASSASSAPSSSSTSLSPEFEKQAAAREAQSNPSRSAAARPPLFAEFQPPARWSDETIAALRRMRAQAKSSAIVEIKARPYEVTVNDVVVTMRMNDLNLGDVVLLDRVREISTEDFVLKGHPYIYPAFYTIKAVVIEHPVSGEIVRHHWKRKGHQPVHRNRTHHTALRIAEITINDVSNSAQ